MIVTSLSLEALDWEPLAVVNHFSLILFFIFFTYSSNIALFDYTTIDAASSLLLPSPPFV
jgi:hypothetical protein